MSASTNRPVDPSACLNVLTKGTPLREAKREKVARLVKTPLRYVSVHLTDYCNSKCEFCVVSSPIRQIPIETSELVDFVRSFRGKGYDVLNLHGGEPTISKALFPVLEAGREIGLREAHLQTNGVKLYKREYVRKLMDHGVRVFVISLHGHTAELQESVTLHKGTFRRIIKGIENCLQEGAVVRTNTVVCRQNIDVLLDILRLAHDMGVPWLNISALHPSEHALSSFHKLVPHPREVRAKLPRVLSELRQTRPDAFFELEGFATCHVPGFEQCHIDKSVRRTELKYHEIHLKDYWEFMDSEERAKARGCLGCRHLASCDGVYKAYLAKFDEPRIWPAPPGDQPA